MTFPLSSVAHQCFHDITYRQLPENPTYCIEVGSMNQGRLAQLAVVLENDKITSVGFKAFGDAYFIATFSWVCSKIVGQNISFSATLSVADIAEALSLPRHKVTCALLAEDGLTQLLELHNARK